MTAIYGLNATAIAAVLEYIMLPQHPMHAQAVEMAAAFIEAERLAKIERTQKMMQDQIDYCSEEEWASIVD
jgi:hypothetical protein